MCDGLKRLENWKNKLYFRTKAQLFDNGEHLVFRQVVEEAVGNVSETERGKTVYVHAKFVFHLFEANLIEWFGTAGMKTAKSWYCLLWTPMHLWYSQLR